MTTRTKGVFFIITGLAFFLVAGVLIFENVFGYTLPTRGGVSVDIRVAVAPELERWVSDAAVEFNNRNPQITVEVLSLKGLDADQKLNVTDPNSLIEAWIAEADFIRSMAGHIPYDEGGGSVAQTRLVWLAVNTHTGLQGILDWDAVHDAAIDSAKWQSLSSGDFQFDAALPAPGNSVEGLAAYISAAANYQQQFDLRDASVTDPQFLDWMNDILEAVPERNRAPLDQLARPPVSVDVGILLESKLNQLDLNQFIQQTPGYNVIFTYPYLIRRDANVENAADREKVAQQFNDFLLSAAQQQKLGQFGFAQANDTSLGQSVQIDGNTAGTLWRRVQ